MKEIILSDYVGDQIRKRETERRRDFQSGMSGYMSARARRMASLRRSAPILMALFIVLWSALFFALWRAADGPQDFAAASGGFILTITAFSLAAAAALFLIGYAIFMPRRPRLASAGDDESRWRVGREGEDNLAEAFRRDLGDEWTLLKGYKNPGGEIDQILVGPPGVIAIEIKNYSGAVRVSGDMWMRDRHDRNGNLMSREPIADGGGRSPSVQVNAAASILQRFLNDWSSGAAVRVSRAAILTHANLKLGNVSNPTVDYILTLNDIRRRPSKSAMLNRPARFDRNGAGRIVNLIQRDHQYHNNGGGRGTRPQNQNGGKGTRPKQRRRRAAARRG